MVQEYTDDTAELRRQLDSLGGMAALHEPERQLQAIMELEQAVSAVGTHAGLLRGVLGVWVWVWGTCPLPQSSILRQSVCQSTKLVQELPPSTRERSCVVSG